MSDITVLLLRHYLWYLQEPEVFLATIVILGTALIVITKDNRLSREKVLRVQFPGCYRLGLQGRSNLDDISNVQHLDSSPNSDKNQSVEIKALFTYPLKSCRGVELKASEVLATGLKYDRIFTFAEHKEVKRNAESSDPDEEAHARQPRHEWKFITQREYPKLAMLVPELWVSYPKGRGPQQTKSKSRIDRHHSSFPRPSDWAANGGCLSVKFPGNPRRNSFIGSKSTEMIEFRLPLHPGQQRADSMGYTQEKLSIWIDKPLATNVTNEIDEYTLAKLKRFLGVKGPLGLFRVDDNNLREVIRSLPQDTNKKFHVGFTDAFPLHLLSVTSIHAVNGMLPRNASMKDNLHPLRFRANIYTTGSPAFAEESWRKLKIGRCIQKRRGVDESSLSVASAQSVFLETDGEYFVSCRTARCKMPNVHPETGERDINEPYATMSKNRDVDPGASPYPILGMQMIPLFIQGVLRVGDKIQVSEEGEHLYEPMF